LLSGTIELARKTKQFKKETSGSLVAWQVAQMGLETCDGFSEPAFPVKILGVTHEFRREVAARLDLLHGLDVKATGHGALQRAVRALFLVFEVDFGEIQ